MAARSLTPLEIDRNTRPGHNCQAQRVFGVMIAKLLALSTLHRP